MTAGVEPLAPVVAVLGPTRPADAAEAADAEGELGRLPTLLVFAIVLAVGVTAIAPHPLGVFSDDAMYAVLARSLIDGEGYRFIHLPGAPSATHFPPVYPLLLAFLWKLWPSFPDNVLLFKSVNAVLNAIAAVLAFRLAVRTLGLPRWAGVLAAVIAGIAVPSLALAGMVLSEPLFLVLLLAVLPLAERVRREPTDRGALLLGAVAGLLVLTRSIGIAFVGSSLLVLLLARRWRAAALTAAVAAAFIVPWNAWVAAHDDELAENLRGKYGSYSGWLVQGVERHGPAFVGRTVERNAPSAMRMVSEPLRVPYLALVPHTGSLPIVLARLALFGLGLLGIVAFARAAPALAVTFAAYVGVVLVWPFEPTRFLWGVWPLIVLLLAAGAHRGLAWSAMLAPRWRAPARAATLALAAIALAGASTHLVHGIARSWPSAIARQRSAASLPVVFWVQENTRPGDVVASDEEAMVFLYTGRRGVPNSRFTADEYLFRPTPAQRYADFDLAIARHDPDWVVVSMLDVREPALRRAAERGDLRRVGTLPNGELIFQHVR